MKKNLFVVGIILSAVLLVSPISGAVVNKSPNNFVNNQDVMYASKPTKTESNVDAVRTEKDNFSNESTPSNDRKEVVEPKGLKAEVKLNYRSASRRQLALNKKNENKKAVEAKAQNVVVEPSIKEQSPANQPLSEEQAVEMLKKKNNKVNYEYMGDEKKFNVLEEKGHQGYVYLPKNVNTDMGMFVDKNTKEVYYFHPSGYLDIY